MNSHGDHGEQDQLRERRDRLRQEVEQLTDRVKELAVILKEKEKGGGEGTKDKEEHTDVSKTVAAGANNNPDAKSSMLKRHTLSNSHQFANSLMRLVKPWGVAVNADGDVIVADPVENVIKIFDKGGNFKFELRGDNFFLPNTVAVNMRTGDLVFTQRLPAKQVQVYDKDGYLVRKFVYDGGVRHPRGICVDDQGRIIVVNWSDTFKVVIFDPTGNVIKEFGRDDQLVFPNRVAVDNNDIFISDHRSHCVKVFDYEGNYLREIGDVGVTDYPIGVGINPATGEVVVVDNTNTVIKLSVFSQQGNLLRVFRSPEDEEHFKCLGVTLAFNGNPSVVVASRGGKGTSAGHSYRLNAYNY